MRIRVIPVASDLGAPRPGAGLGPQALRLAGLERALAGTGDVTWARALHPPAAPDGVDALARLGARLARTVRAAGRRGEVPLVLGGDHSIAVGTWSGVAAWRCDAGPIGLVWVDAHMDAHTERTTQSGNLHGMPLAALLGHGDPRLAGIGDARPKLRPEFVCIVGARSWEAEEAEFLARLGVRVFTSADVRARGIDAVIVDAIAIASRAPGGFGVTFDVDALDPEDAPGVTTPEPEGLRAAELAPAFARLAREPGLVAVEVVEYNPLADVAGATARVVVDLVARLLPENPAMSKSIELEHRYSARNYAPLPAVITRGEGVWVWDEDGRRCLDMMSAYSAVSLGHAHPELVRVLAEQASRLAVVSRAFYNDRLPPLLEALCKLTGLDRALPVNTGLEAVETALKAARKWAHKVKGVPEGRAEIVCCEGNFHGRSIAIVGMSSETQYRDGFGPFPGGVVRIPFGDAAALERAIGPHTAAFLVEPIQGEGGIVVPPPGYLGRCAEICRANGVLLIVDEVQTGLGRTGTMFAFEHDAIRPDGICLGKALGGGLLPVSAFVGTEAVMQVFTPGDHGSTFGGNPLGAAVAVRTLELIADGRLPERAARLGERLMRGLRELRNPLVREVRGRGLLVGLELDTAVASAREVAEALLAHGLLTKDTHGTVLRFAPPLTIGEDEIDFAVATVGHVLGAILRGQPVAA
jgi:ornithine--oxo-acid transaminase